MAVPLAKTKSRSQFSLTCILFYPKCGFDCVVFLWYSKTYPLFLSVLRRCFSATTSSRGKFCTRLFSSLTVKCCNVSSGMAALGWEHSDKDVPHSLPPSWSWGPGLQSFLAFLYVDPPGVNADPTPELEIVSHFIDVAVGTYRWSWLKYRVWIFASKLIFHIAHWARYFQLRKIAVVKGKLGKNELSHFLNYFKVQNFWTILGNFWSFIMKILQLVQNLMLPFQMRHCSTWRSRS